MISYLVSYVFNYIATYWWAMSSFLVSYIVSFCELSKHPSSELSSALCVKQSSERPGVLSTKLCLQPPNKLYVGLFFALSNELCCDLCSEIFWKLYVELPVNQSGDNPSVELYGQ